MKRGRKKANMYIRTCRRCGSYYRTKGKYSEICDFCCIKRVEVNKHAKFEVYTRRCRRCENLFKTKKKYSKICNICLTEKRRNIVKKRIK